VRIRHYQDLKVWQTGMDLVAEAYRIGLLPARVRSGLLESRQTEPSLKMCDAEGRMLASLIRCLRSLPPKTPTPIA